MCEHLRPLERELQRAGITETFRGRAWSKSCGEWAYFECVLALDALRQRLSLPSFVVDHVHVGTHDGHEAGFVCERCHDAVIGSHPDASVSARTFR